MVAGDLNSDRLDYYSLVKEWMENQEYSDVFEGYKNNNYITYNHWQQSIFDYIFINGPIKTTSRYIPVSNKLMPNEEQGSDHFPLYCQLYY